MRTLLKKSYKDWILDLGYDIVGSIFYSISIYTFAKMANFAPGGISGLALIMNYLWDLPIGAMSLVLNIPLILISLKVLGRNFLLKTARTMIFCSIFLDVIFPYTPVYTGNPFMAALYSGLCLGVSLALFYMRGSSSGGTDFLTMTIKTLRPHLSIGFVTMAIDFLVILLGWPVFGNVDAVLYGLVMSFIASVTIDKIMYGTGAGKLSVIITSKGKEVARHIGDTCDRGSTAIKAMGTYTGQEKDVLLCACSKSQAYAVRNAVHQIDPDAFVMITETSEVFGEGFIEKK